MKKYFSLLPFLMLVFAAGALGSYYTIPAVQGWYQDINKPSWTPPDAIFGPVWTMLYIMIAISGWRAWNAAQKKSALPPYWVQLALNAAWSVFFFGFREFLWAAIDIIGMLIAIAATIGSFKKIDKPAAWLLLPYFLWVAFAASLNIAILAMN